MRTSPRHTMKLAQTLAEDGFEVWTPTETRKIRVPRMNIRRDVVLALMPSYIFARADQAASLILLADANTKALLRKAEARKSRDFRIGDVEKFTPDELARILAAKTHEDFHVMKRPEGIPTVSDADLLALRKEEAKRTPLPKAAKAFRKGEDVRVEGGSFGGMSGSVERSDRTHTLVCFNGRYVVKIPTTFLRDGTEDMDAIAA